MKRCLSKDPEDRWQTARDVRAELEWLSTPVIESAQRLRIGRARDRTLLLVTLILGGINLACLGIIAVYQSVMYDELKGRPGFIVRRDRSVRSSRSIRMVRGQPLGSE